MLNQAYQGEARLGDQWLIPYTQPVKFSIQLKESTTISMIRVWNFVP